jgi:hypothetical protein
LEGGVAAGGAGIAGHGIDLQVSMVRRACHRLTPPGPAEPRAGVRDAGKVARRTPYEMAGSPGGRGPGQLTDGRQRDRPWDTL